jgi:hypothetical protein
MIIDIDGQLFDFADASDVSARGYDLDITEPGFDKSSEKYVGGGTSKPISLPIYIEMRVSRCRGLEPCCRVYQDSQGRKRLSAYFD